MAMRLTAAAPLKSYLKDDHEISTPFIGYVDDTPCWITAILDRTAVWCRHESQEEKHLANLDRCTAFPEHITCTPISRNVVAANKARRKGWLASRTITVRDIYS